MEILAAYVRKNSSIEVIRDKNIIYTSKDTEAEKIPEEKDPKVQRMSEDIQRILTIIGNHKKSKRAENDPNKIFSLRLNDTYLQSAILYRPNFELILFLDADLKNSFLNGANFKRAYLARTILEGTSLKEANFKEADLIETNFKGTDLKRANFEGANLKKADFEGADLKRDNFKGAKNLTVDQLSKVKTLYKAELDPEIEKPLREKYPALFEKPQDEP